MANAVSCWTIRSCTAGVTPRRVMPSRSAGSIIAIASCDRLKPIARRSASAWPGVKPAMATATFIPCSWKRGTPRVLWRIGFRSGCR